MKISLLTDVLFSGGAHQVARDVGSGLARRGHAVSLWYEYDGKPEATAVEGVRVAPIPLSKLWFRFRFSLPRQIRYLLAPIIGRPWDYALARRQMAQKTDIWNVHNIHGKRMPLSLPFYLSQFRPLIWTFHDMWPITGGCAFAGDCDGFTQACHNCGCELVPPATNAPAELATRRSLWRSPHNITIVTPSEWLREEVRRSAVAGHVRVEVIPNGIDPEVFRPIAKDEARRSLGLAEEAHYILVLANQLKERRKGAEYAHAIIQQLLATSPPIRPIYVGHNSDELAGAAPNRAIAFPYTANRATIALYYAAADLFLFTSLAENLPLTILEAMACGTPVVAFACGGVPEEIIEGQTGFIRPVGDVAGVVSAVLSICQDQALATRLGQAAREHLLNHFTLEKMAAGYERLLQKLVRRG
jgi:glycosyltransferase involved in cell wall biosynthesis